MSWRWHDGYKWNLSHNVVCNPMWRKRNETNKTELRALSLHVSMFMCFVWKVLWVSVVTLSLVSCSVSPRRRNTKSRVLSFWMLQFMSWPDCVLWSSISSVAKLLHTFTLRKRVISGVVFTPPVGYSRPPSAVNDPTVTKWLNSWKSFSKILAKYCKKRVTLFTQDLTHLLLDFLNYKKTTRRLANSTMLKMTSVPTPIVWACKNK